MAFREYKWPIWFFIAIILGTLFFVVIPNKCRNQSSLKNETKIGYKPKILEPDKETQLVLDFQKAIKSDDEKLDE